MTATLKTTNIKHESVSGDQIVLGSSNSVTLGGAVAVSGTADVTGAATFSSSITMSDTELVRPILKDYGEKVNAIGSIGGGTQDIDLTLGNVVTGTVDTATTTFTFSNPTGTGNNCGFTLYLTNGGSQTVNWPGSVDWPGATAPTLTAAGKDILVFQTTDGGTTWYGNLVSANYG